MVKIEGRVKGMDCASCVAKITKNLEALEGVSKVNLNLVSTKLEIEADENLVTEKDIIKVVKNLGYSFKKELEFTSFFNPLENKELAFTATGLIFLVVGLLLEFFNVPHPHPFFLAVSILVGGIPVFVNGYKSLKAKTIDIDLLMVIAIIGASVIGEWEEAAEIVILFSIAELLEGYSMDKARGAIKELMDLTPPTAIKLIEGKKHEVVPVDELVVGDRISIKPGATIPIDGKIEWGSSLVDQSAITGESKPVKKEVGDNVYGGSINLHGYLVVRVVSMPNESTIARIIHMIEEAENNKAKAEQFVQKFAKYYTPIMVSIAVLVTVIPLIVFLIQTGSFVGMLPILKLWFYRSLVILVVSCPCALVLSTPVTVATAITRATKKGVLIKGGRYLEALSSINTIAIDKTGTLTLGKIKVYKVELYNGYTEEKVLEIVSGLESHSEHLIAKAITEYANEKNVESLSFDEVEIIPGKGIKGKKDGITYSIGNDALVNEISGNSAYLACDETESVVSYVLEDKKIIAHIHMSDELRPETKSVIQEIKELGIKNIIMLTGDNERVASSIAKELSIDYDAELLPEDKVKAVKELREKYGNVAMIGDGINDAPALALADVSISMGSAGTAVAIETSDIVLSSDNLKNLPYLIKLSKKTKKIIQINITFALTIKLLFFILVFFGIAILWLAVLLGDVGASLIVIGLAMTVGLEKKLKRKKNK
ncbi:MAG: heavy metal translocating P-type ATPase [Candidatus Heimdallarchaeaceae archaeon]